MGLRHQREKPGFREDELKDFLSGSRGGGKKRAGRRGFAGPLIIACAVITMLVAVDYWMNSGKIYRGVEVGTIALGGKTPAEAERIVEDRTSGALKEIRLSGPEEFTRSAGEMGVDFNVAATVDQAYAVGREGDIFERLGERFKALYGDITIPPDVDYQPAKARAQVENLAARLDEKPRDASMTIYGSETEVVESAEGYKTDVAATMESVDRSVRDMTGEAEIVGEVLKPEVNTQAAREADARARKAMDGQIVMKAEGQTWTLSPAQIGATLDVTREGDDINVEVNSDRLRESLANVYAALTVEPVEADYVVNGTDVSVTPGQIGSSVQDEKFLNAVESGIFTGTREYEVPVVKDKPEFTTAEAERLKPTELLGEYSTNYMTYDDSPGRVKNLEIVSNAVSGTLLAPGEVFSFNALAEPLDYYDTKVIVGGKVDTAEGGGLCQVSSTLYMAVNLAGLDVVERYPHYAELPYIRPGFDATVWFGALDMKFKNTSPGYVLVQQWVDKSTGDVNAAIYGRPSGVEVDMSSEKVAEYEDAEGNPVTEWVTYQTVRKNGKVVQDGVLHEDTYKYLKPAEEDAPNDARPPN